jgi:very-short-patch-repair endonuclease
MDQRDFAKKLRRNMTEAERLLWYHLRAHRLCGHKFRRQVPIGPYIVDFLHCATRLVVEADGAQHNEGEPDAGRDAWLKAHDFRVLRFWNHDILQNTQVVLEVIYTALQHPLPRPLSRVAGEGRKANRSKP